nr:immunoglobulin light chain junction region [Macaca mulatta]MOV93102.1 immunoglobulin light chain junction region [Macaca mulatta]
CLQYNNKPFTF